MRPVAFVQTLVFAVLFAFAGISAASALEQKKFDAAEFKAAQAAGKPTVIHVSAPWCPTCKAQHEALDELATMPQFASITLYQVDFDSQKDVLKSFGANQQSTLIAYSGAKETGRMVGQTGVKAIEDLLTASMKN